MNRKTLILLTLLCICSPANAQFWRDYTVADGLSDNRVYRIVTDSVGFLWFYTGSGMDRFDGTDFVHFDYKDDQSYPTHVSTDTVKSPTSDRKWFIRFPYGVRCCDPDFPKFDVIKREANEAIWPPVKNTLEGITLPPDIHRPICALTAQDGTLYVGTANNGIHVLKGKIHEQYRKENSALVSNSILALVEDSAHTIVMSTANGLARFYPKQKTFFHWLPSQGMEVGTFLENSACRTDDGKLAFGTYDGTIIFDESIRIPRSFKSHLILTNISAGGEEIGDNLNFSPLHLSHIQGNLSMDISNICFDNPHEILYQWIFSDGHDTWNRPSRDRHIHYKLTPGEYSLTIRAISSDDFKTLEEQTLNIKIDEPWWWNSLAKGGYILLAALLGGFIWRLIIQRNRRKKTIEKLELLLKSNHSILENLDEQDDNEFLMKVNQIVTKNLSNDQYSVVQLYEEMGMSRTSFFTRMKKATGFGPLEFIRECRMQHARQLLRTTRKNISEIAYDCGYNDPKYFSDVFKKQVGVNPTAFRKGEI